MAVIFAITVGGVEHETEHTGPLARAAPRNRRVPARTKFPTTRPCAPPWLVARNYDPKSDHVSPSSLSQGAFSVALSTGLAALDTRNAEKHNEPAPTHSITRRSAAETIPGWRCRTTKAPAEAGASFGLMKRALARGELSDQRDAAKLNLVLWPKCAGSMQTLWNQRDVATANFRH